MGYGWEPRWVKKRFKIGEGVEIETCLDEVTRLILCPLCVNVTEVCKEGAESHMVPPSGTYFFSPEDLALHMRAHARYTTWTRVVHEKEEVEIEEEIEEE